MRQKIAGMSWRKLLLIAAFLTVILSSGCSFFPQTVEIKPGQKAYIAKPVNVYVYVTDKATGKRLRCIAKAKEGWLVGREKNK
jgi:amino acid permease